MRMVIQRVLNAEVVVDNNSVSAIQNGLLVLLGITHDDNHNDIDYLLKKLINLRIFNDEAGKMNLSVSDIEGAILVVSQFTLYADTAKGNRPSYIDAARPEKAQELYIQFCDTLKNHFTGKIQQGIFGADMKITLLNDGPVTIILDSRVK
jgi:D-tyrosyl-tRNA(Tyr) deacylase